MSQKNVAIVGAGIAGLAFAAALDRLEIDFDVYEQAPLLSEVGAGVQLAPNATRLLHRLGLSDHLRATAVAPEAIEIRRWDDGTLLQRTPLGQACRDRFRAPYYTMHRADLHSGLLSLIPHERVHVAAQCVGVAQTDETARLEFSDRTKVYAALAIGADGIHSVVRESLAHDHPRYSGQTIYRGLVPAERVPHLLDEPRVLLWFGPGQHLVCYPVSSGRQVNFAATVAAPDWSGESWSARAGLVDVAPKFAGWHKDVTDLIRAADEVGRWALHDRESLDRLGCGRVAVIGDAAHPMLPFRAQGANQAIEDAVVLARCLSKEEGRDAALRRYERIRLPRTDRIQQESRESVRTYHLTDGDAQRDRDAAAGASSGLDEFEWLWGYDSDNEVK
jgi:salicylate hydroxylase